MDEQAITEPAGGTPAPAIRASGIAKRFGNRVALRDVSFAAAPGERVGVIGPNGAGKTTLLSILAGMQGADAGTVERRAPRTGSAAAQGPGIGWVPQQAALYRRLTVAENLLLFARLEGCEDPQAVVEEMLEQTSLGERRDDAVATLSGGNQQRVNIAIGLLARPPVLFLDEPSTGLDPHQRERLWEFVSGLTEAGTAVLFSTHNIAEAERWGERLFVLADGEGVYDGTPDDFHRAVVAEAEEREGTEAISNFEAAFVEFLRHRGH